MIKLSEKEKMLFVKNKIEQDFDTTFIEKDKINFETNILEEFEDLLQLSDIKNIQKWFENVNIPNTKAEDFKERIIETSSGKILIGIRFLGMDISKPFVNVWTSFAIEKELENIIEICKQEFKIFKPKHIRFWSKNKKQKNVCQNHIVGNIQEICVSKKPINYENVALEKITNLDFYAWYEKMYTQFHKDFPELKAYVSINSLETFTDIMKQKMCYFIYFEGEKVGLIAANKDECLGMSSIYMYEIIIDKKFKGKKIATASQRKLIELHKESYTYINGNIDSRNIPSTKNALRLGRKIISSEILLPI
ncbi:MAG: hypothetical protein ACPGVH_08810 [Chitinophagales bacterium]